jgi:hypothetical protein
LPSWSLGATSCAWRSASPAPDRPLAEGPLG